MAGTWATHATPALGGKQILDMICVGSGKFVAVGETGTVLTSSDSGVTWTSRTAASAVDWFGLGTDGAGNVVAVRTSNTNAVMTSADFGVTWTLQTAPDGHWQAVCWDTGSNQWVAISNSAAGPTDQVMTSPDGVTWTGRTAASTNTWIGVASSGSLIMAVDDVGNVMTSTNGIAWTGHASPNTQMANGADNGNGAIRWSSLLGAFVIAGFDTSISPISAVAYSTPTGAAWTTASTDTTTAEFKAIQMADGICGFVASMPFDPDFSPATHTMIGNSVDAGGSWTHEDTTFSGLWYIGAWDNSTGTVVYKDATPNDLMLVGTFPLTSCGAPTFVSLAPTSGLVTGDTLVTLTGTNLDDTMVVNFNGTPGNVEGAFNNGTKLTVRTPALAAGAVDVEIVGVGTLTNAFTFVTVISVTQKRGIMTGGTPVTIRGGGFLAAAGVFFDGIPALSYDIINDKQINAITPAHPVGTVDVEILDVGIGVGLYTYFAQGQIKLPPIPALSPIAQPGGDSYGGGSLGTSGKFGTGGDSQATMNASYLRWMMALQQGLQGVPGGSTPGGSDCP